MGERDPAPNFQGTPHLVTPKVSGGRLSPAWITGKEGEIFDSRLEGEWVDPSFRWDDNKRGWDAIRKKLG